MSEQERNEYLFDALFQAAVIQASEEKLAELKVKPEDRHTFSPAYERRKRSILRHHRWRNRFRSAIPIARRAAVVALIIIAISFGSLMSVEAVRNEVVRVVTEWFEQFTNVGFVNEGGEAEGEEIDLRESGGMLPTYIPGGFELVESSASRIRIMCLYQNDAGEMIVYEQMLYGEGDSMSIDNENHIVSQIEVNGYEAILAVAAEEGTASVILVWSDGKSAFSLIGDIEEKHVIAMAESLEEKSFE